MADYRQSCRNPACSYTGFSGHSPGCPVPYEAAQRERERKAAEAKEDLAWKDFFADMSETEIFEYVAHCEDEIAKVAKFERRLRRARDYMNRNYLGRNYLDWKRNG
jgi:hypothetical protein